MTATDYTAEREEYRYRVEERLGILCGAGQPTTEQRKMAEAEALDWVVEERKRKHALDNSTAERNKRRVVLGNTIDG